MRTAKRSLIAFVEAGQSPNLHRADTKTVIGAMYAKTTLASTLKPSRGGCLLSAYALLDGAKIRIITEWNRSATTILLLKEY